MLYRFLVVVLIVAGGCSSADRGGGPVEGGSGDEAPIEGPAAETPPGGDVPATPAPPPGADVSRIGPEGVGCLRIGATPDEVRAGCPAARDTTLALEGMQQPALVATVDGARSIAEVVDGRVWRVTVTAPGPATAEGIQVGTPASRLAESDGARVNTGEGRYFITVPSMCGLSFGLEGIPFDASAPTVEELRTAPESVRVGRILAFGGC